MEQLLIQWISQFKLPDTHVVPVIMHFLLGCPDPRCDCRLIHAMGNYKQFIVKKQADITTSAEHKLPHFIVAPYKEAPELLQSYRCNAWAHIRVTKATNATLIYEHNGMRDTLNYSTDMIPESYITHQSLAVVPVDPKQPASISIEYDCLASDDYLERKECYVFMLGGRVWRASDDMHGIGFITSITQKTWKKFLTEISNTKFVSRRITKQMPAAMAIPPYKDLA